MDGSFKRPWSFTSVLTVWRWLGVCDVFIAGVTVAFTEAIRFNLNYQTEAGHDDFSNHTINGTLRVVFSRLKLATTRKCDSSGRSDR